MVDRDDEDREDQFDQSDESDAFEGLGEFGITSAELPAVDVAQQRRVWQEQQARLVQEEKLRTQCFARIQRGWREERLSNPAYDLLQDEFACGLIPDLYRDEYGVWYVFSAHENRRYTLGSWERHTQDMLEISDPERVTERITAPPIALDPAQQRWQSPDAVYPNYQPTSYQASYQPWATNNPNVAYENHQSQGRRYARPTPRLPVGHSTGRPTPQTPQTPHMRPPRPSYRSDRKDTGR